MHLRELLPRDGQALAGGGGQFGQRSEQWDGSGTGKERVHQVFWLMVLAVAKHRVFLGGK
ncbi:hypothetical protein [Arthrobacter sp. CAN_C5]|uniref:hypothetical protein n=1 Tax=Arthrobacter sp. CAN_C5 TaxID=2760706 RepID=UPI001AE6C8EA|nr:hypothetical protein [Arthrobacter sp. CAN_C5]MBP2217798.1 hypothetical protein [Arthrobacter sp. CAN_C5]